MNTIIHWYRNDLRVHDLPGLAAACSDGEAVVPLFIYDKKLLNGRHGSANRNRFLEESLQDLQVSLRKCGGDLVTREGDAAEVLVKVAKETGATRVHYTIDYTPYARRRDRIVHNELSKHGIDFVGYPGRLAVDSLGEIHTKSGTPHKVFTPFWNNWQTIDRRPICDAPKAIHLPNDFEVGVLQKLVQKNTAALSPNVLQGGETAGRERLETFLDSDLEAYDQSGDDMAGDRTSRLSAYLHFGCVSVREIETMLPDSAGARAWHRQLAWREFYHYVMLHFPKNSQQEFQERFRMLAWLTDEQGLRAWQQGATGYPIVDAAMRQLNAEGWMHNRARLIVGSFLTKDLQLDWREGEKYFMNVLIDGDEANNNGNWQWIASVGVDPAPVFRRLYNPSTQQERHDPRGEYVKRYVPELKNVPLKYLSHPWDMSDEEQNEAHCVIGKHYPSPIVDHKAARLQSLERYRAAGI